MNALKGPISTPIPEIFTKGCWVIGQQSVDQSKELHHSFILAEILMALQKEYELMPIASWKASYGGLAVMYN